MISRSWEEKLAQALQDALRAHPNEDLHQVLLDWQKNQAEAHTEPRFMLLGMLISAFALLILLSTLGYMVYMVVRPPTELERAATLCTRMEATFGQPYQECMDERR